MSYAAVQELRDFQDSYFGADPLEDKVFGQRIELTSAQAAAYGHSQGNLDALIEHRHEQDDWLHDQLQASDPSLDVPRRTEYNLLCDYLAIGSATVEQVPWGPDEPHHPHQHRYHITTPEWLDEDLGEKRGRKLLSIIKVTLFEPGDTILPGNRFQRVVARVAGWTQRKHIFVEVENSDWDKL